MKILGWIRVGDKTACGGTVIEGSPDVINFGKRQSFQGARIACRRNCIIAEGQPSCFMSDGKKQPYHGHVTAPGACPLISTLNEIDGWEVEDGAEIAASFAKDEEGNWVGVSTNDYDQHFFIKNDQTNAPLAHVKYRITLDDGRMLEGVSDENGLTEKISANSPLNATIEIFL